jgi:hypothetical protein
MVKVELTSPQLLQLKKGKACNCSKAQIKEGVKGNGVRHEVEFDDASDNAKKLGKAARSGARKGIRIDGNGIISVEKMTGRIKKMEGDGLFDSVPKGVNKAVSVAKKATSSKSWSKGVKAIASAASDAAYGGVESCVVFPLGG